MVVDRTTINITELQDNNSQFHNYALS